MGRDRMKSLKLVAIKTEREMLLREMLLLGCVQLSEPEEAEIPAGEKSAFSRDEANAGGIWAQRERLLQALRLLDRYAPDRLHFFRRRVKMSKLVLLEDTGVEQALELAEKLLDTQAALERNSLEQSEVRAWIKTLEPWKKLDVPLEMTQTESCFIIPGTVSAQTNVKALTDALNTASAESCLFAVNSDRKTRYLLLIGMRSDSDCVLRAMETSGFEQFSAENLSGTAGENLAALAKKHVELVSSRKALVSALKSAAAHRNAIRLASDRLLIQAERAEGARKLLSTPYTVNLEGWLPESQEGKLAAALKPFCCAWETARPSLENGAKPPEMPGAFKRLSGKTENAFRPFAIRPEFAGVIEEHK